jgi:hypothetical protein
MPADNTHNRAFFGKMSFSAPSASIFRLGDSKRRWEVLLAIALRI